MDTKLKNYSHSIIIKIIVFIIAISAFTAAMTMFINLIFMSNGEDIEILFEDSYFHSKEYIESSYILLDLNRLIEEYKSEEYILNEGSITEDEIDRRKEVLLSEFRNSDKYNHKLNREENYEKFIELYSEEISNVKDKLIQEDLEKYNSTLKKLNKFDEIKYYATDGKNVFTNTSNTSKEYFKSHPSYIIFSNVEDTIYPKEILENNRYSWMRSNFEGLEGKDRIYLAFTEEYLNSKIDKWHQNYAMTSNTVYKIIGFSLLFMISFIYLIFVIGRNSFNDKEIHLNTLDRLFTDINIFLCIGLITLWVALLETFISYSSHNYLKIMVPITFSISVFGLILVLSLIKHTKNKTLIKHSLTYKIFHKFFIGIRDIYNSGSIGIKVVLLLIVYPILVVLTFFMFPITIGIGVWLALKKVKEFNEIKDGVERVKNGDIYHKIQVNNDGEFGKLASNINSITEGLNKAVDNELKSERLKTELITNVSHDIRTPLTSIITYIDLIEKEDDKTKIKEYTEILEKKSQRLKQLTDDLFEASKASSGNIPVNLEKINVISLITQGLGELDDKIKSLKLDFKINKSKDKIYVKADGKLLWRSIENLISNIFKYALKESRVYIDIEDLGKEIKITIKNISAYQLNISTDELMERFKRGDESRSSNGSGLGLSIAKSLIELQKGKFDIEIDGDLFKTIIILPKYN